jgi:penicillin V acylase-like amidase (Ntn superfamily)
MILSLLCFCLSFNEILAQQSDNVKINYDSLTINYDKIYALALFSDVKGALKMLDTSSVKNNADKVFKTEFENRFKYGFDKTDYFFKTDTTLNPLNRIFQEYWRKSLLNTSSDSIYEKEFLQKLLVFFKNENLKTKFIMLEISHDNIAQVYESYIKFKGFKAIEFRKSENKYDFFVWKTETDTNYVVSLINDTLKLNVRFLDDIIAMGWNEYATLGRVFTGGWALTDSMRCVKKAYDIKSEGFLIHYLSHEAQHILDFKIFPGLSQTDLEYRAKLAQLSLGKNEIYGWISYFINHAKNDGIAHHVASFNLVHDMSKVIFNKEEESDIQKWKLISVDKINTVAKQMYRRDNEKHNNEMNICATFCLQAGKSSICGHNNDYLIQTGFITVNRKGLEKTAFNAPPSVPTTWISKYGSITFNQMEIDMPLEGMNEKGLVIIQSDLIVGMFDDRDNRPSLNSYQWIQYQLDNFATLDEVLENYKKIRIECADMSPQHYYVCDSLGNIGIIEFLNGQLTFYKGTTLVYPVLCCDSYKNSMYNIERYVGFGGKKQIPAKWNVLPDLIAKVCVQVKNYDSKKSNAIDYGFKILSEIGSLTSNQWSVIYDINNKKIYFKSSLNKETRTLVMNDFNFSCKNPIKMLDIQTSNTKEKIGSQFFDFSTDYYRKYQKNLHKYLKDNFPEFPEIPADFFEMIVNYPLTSECKGK